MMATMVALLGLGVLAHVLLQHGQFLRALKRRPLPARLPGAYPSISVIRPVRGRDVGAAENFAAALDTGYPGPVETLYVVDEPDDPAIPLLEAAIKAHRASGAPGTASLVLAGAPPAGRTGKLNAMMVGMRAATGELVAFGDSDSRPDRDVLRVLVETLLTTPRAGCAFAPVVADRPAQTSGDVAYALLLNGLYGPAVALAAEPTGDLPFIMGQLMVLRRDALEAVGGLACADGHLVDDMQIGKALAEAGWRNVPSSHPLPIVTGGMDLPAFMSLLRRWLFFQRGGLPHSFTWPLWLRGFEFGFGLVVGALMMLAGYPLEAVPSMLTAGAVSWSVAVLHRKFGGSPLAARHLMVPLGLFLAAPLVHVGAIFFPAVRWRGRDYLLDANAKLEKVENLPPGNPLATGGMQPWPAPALPHQPPGASRPEADRD